MTTSTHSPKLNDKRRVDNEGTWEWGDEDNFYFKS